MFKTNHLSFSLHDLLRWSPDVAPNGIVNSILWLHLVLLGFLVYCCVRTCVRTPTGLGVLKCREHVYSFFYT